MRRLPRKIPLGRLHRVEDAFYGEIFVWVHRVLTHTAYHHSCGTFYNDPLCLAHTRIETSFLFTSIQRNDLSCLDIAVYVLFFLIEGDSDD